MSIEHQEKHRGKISRRGGESRYNGFDMQSNLHVHVSILICYYQTFIFTLLCCLFIYYLIIINPFFVITTNITVR